MDVFVTRGSRGCNVEVWPAHIGIRKFHGCVEFGAAWKSIYKTIALTPSHSRLSECISPYQCRKRFGFYPRKGTAWLIEGKKRTRQDLDMEFSP